MENQQAHFGGCIPDPYFYEDDIFNSEVQAANTLLAIKNEKCVHESFEKASTGTFVATQIPFSYYSSDWHYANYGWPVAERIIKELRDDWGVNVNGGDWVFTTYQVPFDIAEANCKQFSLGLYLQSSRKIYLPTEENYWKRYHAYDFLRVKNLSSQLSVSIMDILTL